MPKKKALRIAWIRLRSKDGAMDNAENLPERWSKRHKKATGRTYCGYRFPPKDDTWKYAEGDQIPGFVKDCAWCAKGWKD